MAKLPVYLDTLQEEGGHPGALENSSSLDDWLSDVFERLLPGSIKGQNVLVKPNLLKAGEELCTTSPDLITAVCRQLLDKGARVCVADSPAFGNAEKVLEFLGILETLRKNGIKACSLKSPVCRHLPCGIKIGISKTALEADLILNIPRFKAHSQMGATCAVKNTFGTVVGFRKALAHTMHGQKPSVFADMILDICQALPPMLNVSDARKIMHKGGPSGGTAFRLGVIAAAASPVAADTCMYHLLNLLPERIPLWNQARIRGIPGSNMEDLFFPRKNPRDIRLPEGIIMPEVLEPITFNPLRFLKGRIKSLLKRLF